MLGICAEDILCGRPQHAGLHVRTIVGTLRRRARPNDAQVLHHGVVPRDQPLRQFTSLARPYSIAGDTVDIHVTPTR